MCRWPGSHNRAVGCPRLVWTLTGCHPTVNHWNPQIFLNLKLRAASFKSKKNASELNVNFNKLKLS